MAKKRAGSGNAHKPVTGKPVPGNKVNVRAGDAEGNTWGYIENKRGRLRGGVVEGNKTRDFFTSRPKAKKPPAPIPMPKAKRSRGGGTVAT